MRVEFDRVQKNYQSPNGEIRALEKLQFQVEEQEFVTLVGPSGCGKSTILNLLSGLEAPTSGEIRLDGRPLRGTSGEIGYMPQKDQLFPWRSIWDNVCLGLEIRGTDTPEALHRVESLLQRYGLWDFRRKLPGQLSGGMRQRCALIRTMATDPGLLLLDEPFSALDYQTRLSVSRDVGEMIRREKKTALLVTHDIAEAISMSDRVLVLSARPGRVKAGCDLEAFRGLSPMERRDRPEFSHWFNAIWKELREDE